MATMVHSHHHQSSSHQHPHTHSGSSSYTPSDFDLLKALTSGTGSSNRSTANKVLRQQQANNLRRPQLDPLILETAASSGPHVTRNHFLHEFYPHPEDPSSSFSWHGYPGQAVGINNKRNKAYASCDVGPEEEEQEVKAVSAAAHIQGSLEQELRRSLQLGSSPSAIREQQLDPNTASLPRAVEHSTLEEEQNDESQMLYRSRQAPRKIRLERERQEQAELVAHIPGQQDGEAINHSGESSTLKAATSDANIASSSALHANLKDVDPSTKLSHSLQSSSAAAAEHTATTEQEQQLQYTPSQTSIFHPDPQILPQLLRISKPSFFNDNPLHQSGPSSSSTSVVHPSTFIKSVHQAAIPIMSLPPEQRPPLQVVCFARTRVPTPHGEVFLHLYKNNWDEKEHLAFVFDRDQLLDTDTHSGAQLDPSGSSEGQQNEHADDDERADENNGGYQKEALYGTLRSRSLDKVWREGETDVERIVRGAYVGRLSPSSAQVSRPSGGSSEHASSTTAQSSTFTKDHHQHHQHHNIGSSNTDPVLVRIHSECFTGETIGSQRCDCGEQLDEAFRLIGTSESGLGIIVYLKQEGRGIGLLEKIKAYNLQDLGHDTVTANLLLGHSADLRNYAIAGEILRDLGVGSAADSNVGSASGGGGREVRLLTNNPDKIDSIEKEGIRVCERVPMVPRGWTIQMPKIDIKKRRSKSSKKRPRTAGTSSTDGNGVTTKKKGSTTKKTRGPKLDMTASTTSITSTVQTPLLSPSASTASLPPQLAIKKPRNKALEKLRNSSSAAGLEGNGFDGIRSVEASASEAEETEDDDAGAESYEMPSIPGSADEESLSANDNDEEEEASGSGNDEEEEDDDEDDSEDSEDREEALEDYLISMNRTGVGMIGSGITHSKELEKYLKTKIERMGHMLAVPAAPPSTPLPLQRGSRIHRRDGQKKDKSSKLSRQQDVGDSDRREDNSHHHREEYEDDGDVESYFDGAEIHGEDMFG